MEFFRAGVGVLKTLANTIGAGLGGDNTNNLNKIFKSFY